MFRKWSFGSRNRSLDEPTSPSLKSPPGSPTIGRSHPPFYQHPSGSRLFEESVSAVLSSEVGSDTTSLGVPSIETILPSGNLRKQSSRLQKARRRPRSPPPINVYEREIIGDTKSEVTTSSSTWTTPLTPKPGLMTTLAPEPELEPSNSISFCPAPHPAESFTEYDRLQVRSDQSPPFVLLRAIAPEKSQCCIELLHTSLPSKLDAIRDIIPQRNGFVDTVIEAYNNHRGLIVRPDDVWLAIMTQFSFFVNGHSDAFRKVFVSHEGKRELVVESGDDRYTMDPASMVHHMTELMEEHITDPYLRGWIMPDFTTTTPVDKATCAVVMMGMMKDYFTYKFTLRCGIPKVTLEGEKKDWEIILHRLEHLKKYGIQTIAWYHLLRPILSRMVAAYDHPTHPNNLDFWNKIAHRDSGSGPQWLSGWITAFCVFNEHGQWQGNTLNEERIREHEPKKLLRPADPLHLTPSHFAAVYTIRERAPYLALDGFPYPTIESQDVPCGYACLNVKLSENGEMMDTMLIAGSVGAQICSTEKSELFRNGLRDTVRPVSAWWYFIHQEVVKMEEGEGYETE